MEKQIIISELHNKQKEEDKHSYNNEDILMKNCLKISLRNSLNWKEKDSLRCGSSCNALSLLKKYESELKEVIEANLNLKKINEVLIDSINLKDRLYLELLNKNKSLKTDCNFLQLQITSKNKFYSANENFNISLNNFNEQHSAFNDSNVNKHNILNKFQGGYFSGDDDTKNIDNQNQDFILLKKQNIPGSSLKENNRKTYLNDFNNSINHLALSKINYSEISNLNNKESCLFQEKLKRQKSPYVNLFNTTSHTRHASLGSLVSNTNNSNSKNKINNYNYNSIASNNKSLLGNSINFRNKSKENSGIINSQRICEKAKLKNNELYDCTNDNLNLNLRPIVNNKKESVKNKIEKSDENQFNNREAYFKANDHRLNIFISPEKNDNNNNSKIKIEENNNIKNKNQNLFTNLRKEDLNSIAEEVELNPTNKHPMPSELFDSPQFYENKLNMLKNQKAENPVFNKLNINKIKNQNSFSNNSIINHNITIKDKNLMDSKTNYNPFLKKTSTFFNNKIINKIIVEETDKFGINDCSGNDFYNSNDINNNHNLNNSSNNYAKNNPNYNNKFFSYYEKLSKLNGRNCEFRVFSNPEKSLLSLSEEELELLISNEDFKKARKTAANIDLFIELFRENSEKKIIQMSDKYFSIISDFEAAIILMKKLKKFLYFISKQSSFLLIEEIADLIIKSMMEIFECEKARIYMFDSITNIFQVYERSCLSSASERSTNKSSKKFLNNNLIYENKDKNFKLSFSESKRDINNHIQKKNEVISEIFERGTILRLNNSADNEKFFKSENKAEEFSAKNMLFCPLKETDSSPSFGVLQLLNKQNSAFLHDDEELIKIFSMQISRILLNARNNNESNSYLGKFKFLFSLQKKFENLKSIFALEFEIRNILTTLFSSEYSQFLFYDEANTQNLFKISQNEIKPINKSIGIIGFVFKQKEYFGVNSTNDCQLFNNLTDIETGLTLLTYPIIVKNEVKAIIQFSYNEKLAYFKKPKDMDDILIGFLLNECERWLLNNTEKINYEDFKKAVQLENTVEEDELNP